MQVAGQITVATGAGQGIGRALAIAMAQAGATVVVTDSDMAKAQAVATEIGALAIRCDVSKLDEIERLVSDVQHRFGRIDIWVSNAGFANGEPDGPTSASDEHWERSWNIHVMAHLRATRLVLPDMIARRSGALINVASAAGLLSQIGDAAYSATKHAAVSLAQSLAIAHSDQGIHVSVVCPLFVATPLLGYDDKKPVDRPNDRVLLPQDVAMAILEGLKNEQFLILPHPEAGTYFLRRAQDMDRWIAGMTQLRQTMDETLTEAALKDLHRRF